MPESVSDQPPNAYPVFTIVPIVGRVREVPPNVNESLFLLAAPVAPFVSYVIE